MARYKINSLPWNIEYFKDDFLTLSKLKWYEDTISNYKHQVHFSILVNLDLRIIFSGGSNHHPISRKLRERKGSIHSEEEAIKNFCRNRRYLSNKYGKRIFNNIIMINFCIGKENSKPCTHCKKYLSKFNWIREIGYFENNIFIVDKIENIITRPSYFFKKFQ